MSYGGARRDLAGGFTLGFTRGLAVYLAVALLPTPLVLSWFLSRPLPAAAAGREDPAPRHKAPLTDLAPPQPHLVVDSAEGPRARLARLGHEPGPISLADSAANARARYPSAAKARKAQVEKLAAQIGDRRRAEKVMANLERPLRAPPSLSSPRRAPAIPDPFVPLPARASYKRRAR